MIFNGQPATAGQAQYFNKRAAWRFFTVNHEQTFCCRIQQGEPSACVHIEDRLSHIGGDS